MKVVAIIPARMGSSRFPGKPLANILGLPMIEHVRKRVALSTILSDVYVATCDKEIHDAITKLGGKSIMTSSDHQRASDRTAEAAESISADVIVMVQGDEPMTYPDMIDLALQPMIKDPSIICTNLMKRITDQDDYLNPNTIKVVTDLQSNALYMSRSPIPHLSNNNNLLETPIYKQVCIIPFSKSGLELYTQLDPTPLEIAESVDMNRFLEHGHNVKMVQSDYDSHAVDNTEDLKLVTKLMEEDPLTQAYIGITS
tara:strand:- start:37537 stop:38304 length:768 start_codon:yes stop_codon:yes gene_type:complete